MPESADQDIARIAAALRVLIPLRGSGWLADMLEHEAAAACGRPLPGPVRAVAPADACGQDMTPIRRRPESPMPEWLGRPRT